MIYNVLPLALIIGLSFVVFGVDEKTERLAFVLTLLLTVAAGRSELVPEKARATSTTLIDFFVNSGYVMFAILMICDVAFDLEEDVCRITVIIVCAVIYIVGLGRFAVTWIGKRKGSIAVWEERSRLEFERWRHGTFHFIAEDMDHIYETDMDNPIREGNC